MEVLAQQFHFKIISVLMCFGFHFINAENIWMMFKQWNDSPLKPMALNYLELVTQCDIES